ncbi:MAG: YbfB/YjiJ family MFS transporter [Stappiaceae bacterium]
MTKLAPSPVSVAIGGLITLAVAMGYGRFVYTPILPFMIDQSVVDPSEAGLIATANYAGYLLGALLAARITLPGGIKTWFVWALSTSVVTTALMGLVDGAVVFGVIRFISGLASAFSFVLASSMVFAWLAKARADHLTGLYFAGVGTGIAVSAAMVSLIGDADTHWRTFWYYSGFFSVLGLIAAYILVPAPSRSEAGVPDAEPSLKMSWPIMRLIVAYGLFGFGYVITATFISTIARQDPALQPLEPYVWLLVGVSAAPSVSLMVLVARRLGNRRTLGLACLLEAAGVAVSVLGGTPLLLAIGAILLGGTFVGITAIGLFEARQLASASPRRALGYMTASFGLGQMIGPGVASQFYDLHQDFFLASVCASVALVFAAILVFWKVAPERPTTVTTNL